MDYIKNKNILRFMLVIPIKGMVTIKHTQFATSHFRACLHMENDFVKSRWDLWKTLLI